MDFLLALLDGGFVRICDVIATTFALFVMYYDCESDLIS